MESETNPGVGTFAGRDQRQPEMPWLRPLARRGSLAEVLQDWLAEGRPCARVLIERAAGSTPREAGASMLVTATQSHGTVGGGRLEQDAIAAARKLLAEGRGGVRVEVPLGPAIGQCCGGIVSLRIERAHEETLRDLEGREAAPRPVVLLFGAGHVGRALARAMAPLPLAIRWIDARIDEFDLSLGDRIEVVETAAWEEVIAAAPPGAACIVMTHSHSLDSLVVAAALERGDFAYVGLIGSRTKRRRFERAFRDIGIPEDRIAALVCPIGDRGLRDKRPEVIAAMTAAEVLSALLGAGRETDGGGKAALRVR